VLQGARWLVGDAVVLAQQVAASVSRSRSLMCWRLGCSLRHLVSRAFFFFLD